MISLAAARALIAEHVIPGAPVTDSLSDSFGRVLRQDVRAREDFPPFDRSAMDGYAVRTDDDSEKFRIIGEIQPGGGGKLKIKRGECARIFTGAALPAGAGKVLMQENVQVQGDGMVPLRKDSATHIRYRGEDARKGAVLLKAGSKLGAGELSLLASLGVTQPRISPRIRVAHFATGNELVAPDAKPKPGQIRDSNSTLVAAFVRQFGGELVRQERVVDDFDLLLKQVRGDVPKSRSSRRKEALTKVPAQTDYDLLLLSGGASVGDYDFGKRLLTELGFETHFTAISLRPGKPLVFATRGKKAAFILPGNPVSHFVTLHVAVRLALEKFVGTACTDWALPRVQLAENFESKPGERETYWPAKVRIQNGGLVAHPLRWQSSGDVTALAGANALLQLPAGATPPQVGEDVSVLLLEVP
ncbi:MAG TPA: molybdopterin molybdotransferase MoeA [Verrucomicrobiae bacterium]